MWRPGVNLAFHWSTLHQYDTPMEYYGSFLVAERLKRTAEEHDNL
jgi:hypothetical protein